MKITEKQLLVLLQTTADSLKIGDRTGTFSYDESVRRAITNEVLNQQNEVLVAATPDSVCNDVEPLDVPGGLR